MSTHDTHHDPDAPDESVRCPECDQWIDDAEDDCANCAAADAGAVAYDGEYCVGGDDA